jgi:membrane protease YdiL (CAAX protease family)
MNAFLKRHPLPIYFLLAYGISWTSILTVTGTGRFHGEAVPVEKTMLMLAAMLLGPCLSGLLMTALTGGRSGLGELLRRLLRWRVGAAWYGALLLNPLLTLAVLGGFAAAVSPDYLPTFRLLGVLYGLLAGIFEEIGWTGFATPRLLEKYTPLKAGLILGLLHGGWHTLAGLVGTAPGNEGLWAIDTLVFWVGGLTAYRVLMTWVYARTRSLLLGQLMHLVMTGCYAATIPALAYGRVIPVYAAITVGLWVMVGLVIALGRKSPAAREADISQSRNWRRSAS